MASIVAQCIAIYWPPLAYVFSLTPLSLHDWLIIILAAASIIVVVEAEKFVRKLLRKKSANDPYHPRGAQRS
jgi:Ca2+-transporting ATPase